MAFTSEIMIATTLAGANILLLGALTIVWLRNYQTFRSSLVLGLVVFAVVMLIENATAIFFFFSMKMLYSGDPTVQTAVAILRGLQFVALVFLTWVTMK
ncbi:MAG: hypothetical protein ABEJ48_02890 [Halobacteriales archaeon]